MPLGRSCWRRPARRGLRPALGRGAHRQAAGQAHTLSRLRGPERPSQPTRLLVGVVGRGAVSRGWTRIRVSCPARVPRTGSANWPGPRARARAAQGQAPPRKSCAEKVPKDRTARTTRGGEGSFLKGPLQEAVLGEPSGQDLRQRQRRQDPGRSGGCGNGSRGTGERCLLWLHFGPPEPLA
nr:uncharacterized protein LOC123284724 [Equus asinus]